MKPFYLSILVWVLFAVLGHFAGLSDSAIYWTGVGLAVAWVIIGWGALVSARAPRSKSARPIPPGDEVEDEARA